jgi:hypothetical protein
MLCAHTRRVAVLSTCVLLVFPAVSLAEVAASEANLADQIARHGKHLLQSLRMSSDLPPFSTQTTVEDVPRAMVRQGHGLLQQLSQPLLDRIGWLRPVTLKEHALAWLILAAALPWGFLWIPRSLTSSGHSALLLLWSGIWLAIAAALGWAIWGHAVGSSQFASSMLILAPILGLYFRNVASSLAN